MGRQQRLKKARHQSRQAQLDLIAIKHNSGYEGLVRLPTNREREYYDMNEPFLIKLCRTAYGIRKAIVTDWDFDIDGQSYDYAGVTALLQQGPPYIGMEQDDGICRKILTVGPGESNGVNSVISGL